MKQAAAAESIFHKFIIRQALRETGHPGKTILKRRSLTLPGGPCDTLYSLWLPPLCWT